MRTECIYVDMSNCEQYGGVALLVYHQSMPATGTLLCIHRDPSQLSLLRDKGYGLITASNGSDGLRILMLNAVDAVVIEYYLGLLNGAVVADVVKQVMPHLPIVMIADNMELPAGTLKSVDVVVAKSDGPRLLLESVHSVLQTGRALQPDGMVTAPATHGHRDASLRGRTRRPEAGPFSDELWANIRNGTLSF
jgi:DNA-binding NarL/FixJ family response regulator